MLCMHELPFTRPEPEAKMNTRQPKPDALEVQNHTARGQWQSHSMFLFLENIHLKLLGCICYLSLRIETLALHFNVSKDRAHALIPMTYVLWRPHLEH